jgi:hypothetical protein
VESLLHAKAGGEIEFWDKLNWPFVQITEEILEILWKDRLYTAVVSSGSLKSILS